MCVVALAWHAHPRWKLVAIGNRDELHARPAAPLARWQQHPHLLAGKDMQAGGTWLGVSDDPGTGGRFAVVTNVTGFGAPDPGLASRGALLQEFLAGQGWNSDLSDMNLGSFNPFSLFTVTGDDAWVHTNRPDAFRQKLAPGIHSLSNGTLDNPWPKTRPLNQALQSWMDEDSGDLSDLTAVLQDEQAPPPVPGFQPVANLPRNPADVPIFIRNPVYGTRCSTIVAIDRAGQGRIVECSYHENGEPAGETALTFSWPA
ncbi:NRDE family protein [Parasphingorhabdus sp.]|uniref:NRDE family protein n=1 Tax=Parasphingorhabdus sp. TaxID=2709688 RepID=UPI003263D9E9